MSSYFTATNNNNGARRGGTEDESETEGSTSESQVRYQVAAYPKMDCFEGDAAKAECFLEKFNHRASVLKWTEEEKMIQFSMHLGLAAWSWYRTVTATKWSTVEDAFRRKYCPSMRVEVAIARIAHMRQKEKESLTDYVTRFEQEARHGKEGLTTGILTRMFLQSIKPALKEKALSRLEGKRDWYEMLEELYEINSLWGLDEVEPHRKSHGMAHAAVAQEDDTEGFQQIIVAIRDLENKMERGQQGLVQRISVLEGLENRPGERGEPLKVSAPVRNSFQLRKCYACDQVGHKVKDCPIVKAGKAAGSQ